MGRLTYKNIILTASIALLLNTTFGQTGFNKNIFCSPGISIGYTFGAKINYGFVFDFGLIDNISKNMNLRYGFSYYQYYVKTKTHTHRLRSFSIMGQTDFADVKIGIGRARNKWGFGNKNKCITRGISYDVSFALPDKYSPWLGFRHFKYNTAGWAWFLTPYNSIYLKYKYDIIQNTDLKNSIKFN
jgi:hypothetical protein